MKISHKVEPLDFQAVTITTTPGPTDEDVVCAWGNILRAIVPTLVSERIARSEIKQLIADVCGDVEATEELLSASLARHTHQLRISGKALLLECSERPANLVLCYCEKPIDDCACTGQAEMDYWSKSRLRKFKLDLRVTSQMRGLLMEMKKQCDRVQFTQTSW